VTKDTMILLVYPLHATAKFNFLSWIKLYQ